MARLFISYSHRDSKALGRLHKHLAMAKREGLVATWYDREILAGKDIDQEVQANLGESDIFLALVSPDFLASEYCYDVEMKVALERHDNGSLRVIPVILEPCDWKSSSLGKLKAIPKDGQPISTWTNENVAYLDVVMEIRRVVSALQQADNLTIARKVTRLTPPATQSKRYRIKREFDAIDRAEFREKAFATIKGYFRDSVAELHQIGDPIRARFEEMNNVAFSCTVLNKAIGNREAHITVHSEGMFGEITYSFSRRAGANTANGFIRVEANEYDLYLSLDQFSGFREKQILSAEQAADALWREFIGHAGIDND
jgi:hypothetical protein